MLNTQLFDSKREIEQFKLQLGKVEGMLNFSQPNARQNVILLKQLQNKVANLEQNLESKVNALCSNILVPEIQPQKLPELTDGYRKRAVSTDIASQSIERNIYLQGSKMGRYQKQIQRQLQIQNDFNDESVKQKIDYSFEQPQQTTSFHLIQKPIKQKTQVLLFDCPQPKSMKRLDKRSFIFMIQKGKRIGSVELASFRQKNQQTWNFINAIISRMEFINLKYSCPSFFVDGKTILHLIHSKKTITISDIVKCIQNKEEIIPYLWTKLFVGPDGLERAAEKIQAVFKGYVQFKRFQVLKKLYKKTLIIQRYFKTKQRVNETRQKIYENSNKIYQEFLQRQACFQDDWERIKLMPRIEVHISSMSYSEYQRLTMEKFLQRENAAISRIFRAQDPLVQIIYICPFEQDKEILSYYEKIFELQQISFKKVRFITPENVGAFNSHMSLLQKLLYSPKCLKMIKRIVQNQNAIIIPGYPTNELITLSHILQIPLYQGLPQNHLLYSSQSGAQVLFSKCKIPTSPGASEIYDEIELFNTLTVLIVKNRNIRIWVFKIDSSFEGRGIATINIETIPGLSKLLNQNEQDLDEMTITAIKQIIKGQLPLRLKIAVKSLFKSYQEYITAFLTSGGVVEAFPPCERLKIQKTSISFHVSPSFEFEEICTYDSHSAQHFIQSLFVYPSIQQELDSEKFFEEMQIFFKQKQMFGYFTLHLIMFEKQFWAIGMDCYLNLATSLVGFMKCLNHNQNCYIIYAPIVNHPGIQKVSLKNFFQQCRMEKVQFETEMERGQTFLFSDMLQSGTLQLITLEYNLNQCIQQFEEQLKIIFKIGGPLNVKYGESIYEARNDSITILDIQGALKIMKRKLSQ